MAAALVVEEGALEQERSNACVELTILMPCLNEALTLQTCIRKAHAFLTRYGVKGEVVIADNGSKDGSQDIARLAGARVVDVPVRGYGAALIAGIAAAQGKYVIMGDSDDSYDFSRLDAFVDELRAGTQLVMGNRFRGGIEKGAMPALHRWLGNPVLSTIGRTLYGGPAKDFHCGLRGFDREAVLGLGLCCPGMEFASEMVVKASLGGLSLAEVPTTLSPDGRDRPPHLRSWRDGWRHLRFLLLFSPTWLFLYPGLALLIAGLFGELALLPGPLAIGTHALDVHTMLYCAGFAVMGFQLVLFGVMAKVFAVQQGVLPMSKGIRVFLEAFSVEAGLVLGAVMMAGGATLTYASVVAWDHQQFMQFDPRLGMRMAIPAVTMLVVGMQMIFASMFVGVLGLREHARPSTNAGTQSLAVETQGTLASASK
ncbi:glycosyltransferase family 2 protein [Ottowia sp.]|uniref:glycosyltransferase family 2 protein n=1 Tax=Ottowia sp. TaxID=1898956 RepID=UPI0025EC8D74|nr:glycosyltransferase family 2 protein [Ottowia sp.]MBK6616659.1 glycosyltransferase family 2 protein [Ottowia sp.]